VLTDKERDTLERWAAPEELTALALRCRIVLACADEERTNGDIAAELSVTSGDGGPSGVKRFAANRLDACTTSPDWRSRSSR